MNKRLYKTTKPKYKVFTITSLIKKAEKDLTEAYSTTKTRTHRRKPTALNKPKQKPSSCTTATNQTTKHSPLQAFSKRLKKTSQRPTQQLKPEHSAGNQQLSTNQNKNQQTALLSKKPHKTILQTRPTELKLQKQFCRQIPHGCQNQIPSSFRKFPLPSNSCCHFP